MSGEAARPEGSSVPELSVIVPTFNRAEILAKCLRALAEQSCSRDRYEVIVADDGSTDATPDVARREMDRGGLRVRYLRQENAGANTARNRAIRTSAARLVLLINDDTIATKEMLAEHLATHAEYAAPGVAVLGRVTVSPHLPPSRLAKLHLDRAFARLGDQVEHDWRAFFTCNVSVSRELLLAGGLFEEGIRYHEDLELAERLSHHGLRVIYRPQALGYHDHFLGEEEFIAIAAREAKALAAWARLAPHLLDELGELGFEPALPAGRRLKHRLVGSLVNGATIPLWRRFASTCPASLEAVSLLVYEQIYQSVKRSALRRELQPQRR